MPEFTASDPGSSFPNQNILFNSASGLTGQELQKNQLAIQGQQLDLTAADHEQVGRLAAGLLNIQDPTARAQAYAQGVGVLQSQGLAKYAPPTLPDEQSLRMLVSQTVPVANQITSGLYTPPGLTDALSASRAPLPGQGGAAATPAGAAAGGFGAQLAQSESGGKSSVINPQGYTGTYQFGKQRLADLGYYTPAPGEDMKNNTTWAGKVSVPGFSVTDQQSFAANPAAQQAVFNTHLGNIDQAIAATPGANRFDQNGLRAVAHLGGVEGMQKFVASGGAFSPSDANGTSLAAYYNKFSGGAPGGTPTATAAPPTQFAGPGAPTLPPAATDTPPGPTQPPGAAVAPAQPGQPQPAPAPTAQPTATPPTGVNSPQFQAALELNHRAEVLETQFPLSPAAKAEAASLRAKAALYMQADSVSVDPTTGIQTKQLTGERLNAAAPNAHYVWNDQQGAYVDTTGVHPPVTPPSPRITMAPGGTAIQSKPGGGATVVYQAPAGAVQQQEEAKASGAATGTQTAQVLPTLIAQARAAAKNEGDIDYATNQIAQAAKGGIPTGYFSGALGTAAAVAKSLGINTSALGIDPAAVGDIQSAQKTLAVLGGAILQQAIGKGNPITDAKIEAFEHTQPGIETDPQALQRIMAWARSQYTYEREMGQAAVAEAAKPENNGILPPSWVPRYYHQTGFAPVYDPIGSEMRQPDGSQPARETPPPVSTPQQTAPAATLPPKALSSLTEGHVTTFTNGQQWKLVNGQPVQVK